MNPWLRWSLGGLLALVSVLALAVLGVGAWLAHSLPQREGTLPLHGLSAPVSVRFDVQGVPHIQAQQEADAYRALGFLHAQERLFQMEILRRLARGELADLLGPSLLKADRLFRTLRLRERGDEFAEREDKNSREWQGLSAYLDGINQFQAQQPLPPEFALLGIQPRPFTPADTFSVMGYMAYSFAAAFRTEPVLTHIRDQLGCEYLVLFLPDAPCTPQPTLLKNADWHALQQLSALVVQAPGAGFATFEGSNAWAIAGSRTASGHPLLAGDPHIAFSAPQVWYSAHLQTPDFELYGQYHALIPFALLGHNRDFGWSLTMFQNDDLDLIAEPHDAAFSHTQQTIAVKDAPPETLTLRRSEHGPIINDALGALAGPTPLALRWMFLDSDRSGLTALYQLNRARHLTQAREAAAGVAAPGLNIVWAATNGDIGWWAAGQLLERPPTANPAFILDGTQPEAAAPRWRPFTDNPQEENPERGYVLSANQQPSAGEAPPGYYNQIDRYWRLREGVTAHSAHRPDDSRALQLDTGSGYPARLLAPLWEDLRATVPAEQRFLLDELAAWDGRYAVDSRAAVLLVQFMRQLAHEAFADELGDDFFNALLDTRWPEEALRRLALDPASPWWDNRHTPEHETRATQVSHAWRLSVAHLEKTLGAPAQWHWGRAHTLTFVHPLGRAPSLAPLLNIGPLPAMGGREVPNNLTHDLTPAPWSVTYGPSIRRVIDFAEPQHAQASIPLGQSGHRLDRHYADRVDDYLAGRYQPQWLDDADINAHTESRLRFVPAQGPQ